MLKAVPVAFVIAATLAVTNRQVQPPVAIGLLREDGHLIPIALLGPQLFADPPFPSQTTVHGAPLDPAIEPEAPSWPFANLRWRLYGRGQNGEIVMPPRRQWPAVGAASLALRSARIQTQINTIESVKAESHCSDQAVWRTTLTLPPAQENVAPLRKIALAVTGGIVEQPEDVTDQPDAASRRVARRIVWLTHRKEAERLAGVPQEYQPRDAEAAARAKVAVRLEQLRRHSVGDVSTYYFEAHKAWGPALAGGLVTGWIVDSPTGLVDHHVEYKFNDDSSKENDDAIVWGVFRHEGHALWILEWRGYEWEYYTIHDWPSGVERLRVDGGDC